VAEHLYGSPLHSIPEFLCKVDELGRSDLPLSGGPGRSKLSDSTLQKKREANADGKDLGCGNQETQKEYISQASKAPRATRTSPESD
jgi:hypothetical protein